MANVKNITDLPIAESTEGLNLIVNDNGAAKQIAADKVGSVKSVNGATPDTNGNVEVEIPEGFSGSFNDLKDKPFYEEVHSVTYDVDNIDGATIFINQIPVVKISDNVIPVDSLANVTMTTENGTFTDIKWDGEYPIVGKQIVFIVYEDNAVYSDVTFPKKGIYLMPDVTLTWTETKPLDEKYLPESVKGGGLDIVFIGVELNSGDLEWSVKCDRTSILTKFQNREPIFGDVICYDGDYLYWGKQNYGDFQYLEVIDDLIRIYLTKGYCATIYPDGTADMYSTD